MVAKKKGLKLRNNPNYIKQAVVPVELVDVCCGRSTFIEYDRKLLCAWHILKCKKCGREIWKEA